MAKTKDKKGSKGKKGSEPVIRRVRTKEDRKRPSVFMRLKTDEAFKGVALFEPDPELDDNPGYFEYYDHFDKQANQYVPCAGDACPFCAANDNPSTRALTAWYFPDAADAKDKIKIFTMNYSTINDIADEAEDEDGITGKTVRVKRLSDKGDYKVKVSGKPLSKAELKKAMALLEEKLQAVGTKAGTLESVVQKQLQAQLERLKALDALDDDDDDDDDDDEPKSRKGNSRKGNAADEDEDDDGDEDEDEDDDEDDDDDSDDDDDDSDDDDETEDDDDDSDDEDDEDDDDSDDEDEEETETEPEEISGSQFEVVKVHEKDEIFDLKNDDGKQKMWLGEGVEVDYDEIKKGVNVKIDAAQDDEGDWIITGMSLVKPKGGKKTDTKKGGKKGGKKK